MRKLASGMGQTGDTAGSELWLGAPWRGGQQPALAMSNLVTLVTFQFFAFITTLLYVLHAFSIYYH